MYNVNDIKKFIHEREKNRLLIYEEIVERCYHRIQTSVIRDEPFSLYVVPDFIIGKPKYNFGNCIQYVIFRLKNNGFQVKYIYPNALQIEWGKSDFTTMLSIENDKGTLNKKCESLDLVKKLQLPSPQPPTDDIIFKFKDQNKESKKKQLQNEKFRAINTFLPKTTVFSEKNKFLK